MRSAPSATRRGNGSAEGALPAPARRCELVRPHRSACASDLGGPVARYYCVCCGWWGAVGWASGGAARGSGRDRVAESSRSRPRGGAASGRGRGPAWSARAGRRDGQRGAPASHGGGTRVLELGASRLLPAALPGLRHRPGAAHPRAAGASRRAGSADRVQVWQAERQAKAVWRSWAAEILELTDEVVGAFLMDYRRALGR